MDLLDFILILSLITACVLSWILAQIVWQFIYGKMMIKLQNQRIDAAISKLARVVVQLKRGDINDNL